MILILINKSALMVSVHLRLPYEYIFLLRGDFWGKFYVNFGYTFNVQLYIYILPMELC